MGKWQRRIRRLRALAEDPRTPRPEADLALAMCALLEDRHGSVPDEAPEPIGGRAGDEPAEAFLALGAQFVHERAILVSNVVHLLGGRSVLLAWRNEVHVFAYRSDLARTVAVVRLLLVQLDAAVGRSSLPANTWFRPDARRRFRSGFIQGWHAAAGVDVGATRLAEDDPPRELTSG
jgi:hypothetical protein